MLIHLAARVSGIGANQEYPADFFYDNAEGILLAAERYNDSLPVHPSTTLRPVLNNAEVTGLGSAHEITVRDLLEMIADLTGFDGEIVWDITRPNGQPRRKLETTRAKALFGFESVMPFDEGLRRTIAWYRQQAMAGALTL